MVVKTATIPESLSFYWESVIQLLIEYGVSTTQIQMTVCCFIAKCYAADFYLRVSDIENMKPVFHSVYGKVKTSSYQ